MQQFFHVEDHRRRKLLAVGLAGAAFAATRPAIAQQLNVPDIGQTIRLLEQHEGIGLLYTRFALAEAITTDILTRAIGVSVDNLGAADGLPLLPFDRLNGTDPNPYRAFQVLQNLAFNEGGKERSSDLRDSIRQTLAEMDDPLAGNRGEAVASLLGKVAATLEDYGIPATEGPIADALGSCAHVERIMAVTQPEAESTFLCRIFPFSYFC